MISILTIVDHASNFVPPDIELGILPALLETHIAWDIGAGALADALGYPSIKGPVSRLVIDLNREHDSPSLMPNQSDGVEILGNQGGNPAQRIDRFWRPYHNGIAAYVATQHPTMLLSLHSFTPHLASRPHETRPWEIGVLYNQDDRAARLAITMLNVTEIVVGDQLPYSGKVLNATMNRHGEGTGTPYLGLEIRQDLIGDPAGVTRWADQLRPIIDAVVEALA